MEYLYAFQAWLKTVLVPGNIHLFELPGDVTSQPQVVFVLRPAGGGPDDVSYYSPFVQYSVDIDVYGADWDSAADAVDRIIALIRAKDSCYTYRNTVVGSAFIESYPEQLENDMEWSAFTLTAAVNAATDRS